MALAKSSSRSSLSAATARLATSSGVSALVLGSSSGSGVVKISGKVTAISRASLRDMRAPPCLLVTYRVDPMSTSKPSQGFVPPSSCRAAATSPKRFYVWRPARHLTWTLLMDCADYYPPGPTEVPRHLYRVGIGYRLRAAAMVGGLFTFLVLYLGLIALASVIAFNLLMIPFDDVGITGLIFAVVVKFGGALAAALFAVFLVKGLFKGQRVERAELIPLDEDDHPQFFAFVRRVYQDAGSAAPRHVYVSAHVNAAMIYNSSLLNLVIPPKKDLLIGLGLVNVMTLTEFKAVLAHEFGHFPQRSVGLDTYLYVANRVMYD